MQWKREGNELEWIVRQMSWQPPWTDRGQAAIRADMRNRSRHIHASQPGHGRDDSPGAWSQMADADVKEKHADVVTRRLQRRRLRARRRD